MKILHIIDRIDPKMGGVSQAVRTIVKGLSKCGAVNEIVSLDSDGASFLEKSEYTVIALGPSENSWAYSPKLLPWLNQNMSSYNVVILHGLWQYHTFAATKVYKKLLKKDNTSLFLMPHGMLDPYFQKAKGRKLKAIRNWVYWKLIEKTTVNQASAVLFTCEEERLLAQNTFTPYKPKAEKVVGLGVESPPDYNAQMPKAFEKACPGLNGRNYFLFLSRINYKKGVDHLVEAYAYLLHSKFDKVNQNDIPALVIAGPGIDTPYGQTILNLIASDEKLKGNVFLPGMLEGNAKWGSFYDCDLFVLPSHQENFGIAVVEALACKKPVIISNKVNIWREISNAGAGLVENDDLEGLKKSFQNWYELTEDQKGMMAHDAKALFKKSYSVLPAAKNLLRAIS